MQNNFFERANKIYKWLQDDESKRIYRAFIDYYVSGEAEAVMRLNKSYRGWLFREENSDALKEAFQIENLRSKGRGKAIIYGCSLGGGYALEALRKNGIEIVAAIDKFPGTNQEVFGNIVVRAVNELKSFYHGEAILITTIRPEYREEMIHTLASYGIEDNVFCVNMEVLDTYDPNQYFDESIVNLSPGEQFVDCGGYNLSTTIRLNELCGGIRRAWVFEPDPENVKRCKANKESGKIGGWILSRQEPTARMVISDFLDLVIPAPAFLPKGRL